MTEIRNIYGKAIATGEGTVAEAAATNRANLREANLRGANLSGADLSRADLSRADLIEANLSRANLREADLIEADLIEADMSGADLSRADLSRADLIEANLSRANLSGANLRGANLSGADLRYIPAPLVLLAQWGELPDALTLDLMRYDAANHPEPERFLRWADDGPCPYSGLSLARAANFTERRELIKADFLGLPVKSAWDLTCELAEVKGFRFAPAEVK
jgi:hypothetical protein